MTTPSPAEHVPIGLEKSDDRHLVIQWQDGMSQRIPFRMLRDSCRCAHCTEKHRMYKPVDQDQREKPPITNLPVLSLAETMPIEIVTMHPAGNYGYKIAFSDGHSSGIYSFEMLRSLGSRSK